MINNNFVYIVDFPNIVIVSRTGIYLVWKMKRIQKFMPTQKNPYFVLNSAEIR